MFVLGHQFAIDADVELTVASGNEAEALDVVAAAVKGLASHPGGAEGVTSIVAVLDL